MKKKSKLWITSGVCFFLALYFFMWSIQTSWLGSFPGRDIAYYAFWAYSQLAASVIFFVFAVVSLLKGRRMKGTANDA
jgi:hypothetical protein